MHSEILAIGLKCPAITSVPRSPPGRRLNTDGFVHVFEQRRRAEKIEHYVFWFTLDRGQSIACIKWPVAPASAWRSGGPQWFLNSALQTPRRVTDD